MHRKSVFFMAAAIAVLAGRSASAQTVTASQGGWSIQPWLDRGYFNFNVGFETTSGTLTDSMTFSLYEASGSKTVSQNVDSGSLIDFSVGSRVWRNVSVGFGYHRGANTSEASATASVPNPISFTDPNRPATAAVGDLQRVEQAFHLQVGYMLPLSDVMSVHVTIGPSFFRLKQDVLSDLTFTEVGPPYTSVNTSTTIAERSDSVTGLNVGVDVAYQFYDGGDYKIGGGVFLRYAGASARIQVLDNGNEVDTDVGGLQIGFGARVRF
jgi:hypothetical protein